MHSAVIIKRVRTWNSVRSQTSMWKCLRCDLSNMTDADESNEDITVSMQITWRRRLKTWKRKCQEMRDGDGIYHWGFKVERGWRIIHPQVNFKPLNFGPKALLFFHIYEKLLYKFTKWNFLKMLIKWLCSGIISRFIFQCPIPLFLAYCCVFCCSLIYLEWKML